MLDFSNNQGKVVENNLIIFDLEWANCSIVQIGAVRISLDPFRIVDIFCGFSRPCDDDALKKCVRFLGMSSAVLTTADSVQSVIQRFLDWSGKDATYATWGPCDIPILAENMKVSGISAPPLSDQYYDLQAAFQEWVGTDKRVALSAAVEYCGIPDCYTFHDALNDAIYAAMVSEVIENRFIQKNVISKAKTKKIQELHTLEPTYANISDLMHQRMLHRQQCPICSRPLWISKWFGVRNKRLRLIAKSYCPEHGTVFVQAQIQRCAGQYSVVKIAVRLSNEYLRQLYDNHSGRRFTVRKTNANGKF